MQRSRSEFDMAKSNSNNYCGSYTDDDSGIGLDYDYSSSTDLNSSTMTMVEPSSTLQVSSQSFPLPGTTMRRRIDVTPLIKFASDGIVERVRPATMKNSKNSDYILCRTNRGAYIAYRSLDVPVWVTNLVHEVELRQK
jgi:hypothetical protein